MEGGEIGKEEKIQQNNFSKSSSSTVDYILQVLSKEVGRPCSIREPIDSKVSSHDCLCLFILSPWASETSIPKTWSSVYDQLNIWFTALIGCYHLGIASAYSLGLLCCYLQYHHQVRTMTMDWYIRNNIFHCIKFQLAMLHDMLGFLNAMTKYFQVQCLPISKCARQNIICLSQGSEES